MSPNVTTQYLLGLERRLLLNFRCCYQSVISRLPLQLVCVIIVGSLMPVFGLRDRPATVKSIGDILREGGYREDFAGAAHMNKFAVAFRITNNIVCGRCNSTVREQYCLPRDYAQLAVTKEKCDQEDAYYDTDIEHELDKILPCLIRYSDETTLLCLMETPMGVPPPDKDFEEVTQPESEHTTAVSERTTTMSEEEEHEAGETDHEHRIVPVRRQELVDIVSHAKITRVVIGEP